VFSFSEENDHQHVLDDSDEDASLDRDLHDIPDERIRSVRKRKYRNEQSSVDFRRAIGFCDKHEAHRCMLVLQAQR
jgi:hypothetical protein